jgi:hypothetical protein
VARVPITPATADLACAVSLEPASDTRTDLGVVHDSLFDGEQMLGVYRGCEEGVRLLAVTNRRVMMVETTSCAGRRALTSVPFPRITSVSYLASPDEPVAESTTVAVRVVSTWYQLGCATEVEARELHDLIAWHLVCA